MGLSAAIGFVAAMAVVVISTLKFGLAGFIIGGMAAAVVAVVATATPWPLLLATLVICSGAFIAVISR